MWVLAHCVVANIWWDQTGIADSRMIVSRSHIERE